MVKLQVNTHIGIARTLILRSLIADRGLLMASPDACVDQLDSIMVNIFDELASVRQGNEGLNKARWLLNKPIAAKRERTELER